MGLAQGARAASNHAALAADRQKRATPGFVKRNRGGMDARTVDHLVMHL
jgi:hypothetical protein